MVTLLRVSLLTAPGFPQKPGPTQQYNLLNHSFTFQRKIFKDAGRGGARGHLGFGRWLIFFLWVGWGGSGGGVLGGGFPCFTTQRHTSN